MNKIRAFSLIEILIVIAIIGLVMYIVAPQMGLVSLVSTQTALTNLTRTIKTAYNYSVINRTTHRIVFDLKNNIYWVEASNEKSLITKSKIEREKTESEEREWKEEIDAELETLKIDSQKTDVIFGEEGEERKITYNSPLLEAKQKEAQTAFRKIKVPNIKHMLLSDDYHFEAVQTQHHTKKITAPTEDDPPDEEYKAYMYFLSNGYVERAVIYIAEKNTEIEDPDRMVYTIITNPLSGETEVHNEYKEISFEERKSDE